MLHHETPGISTSVPCSRPRIVSCASRSLSYYPKLHKHPTSRAPLPPVSTSLHVKRLVISAAMDQISISDSTTPLIQLWRNRIVFIYIVERDLNFLLSVSKSWQSLTYERTVFFHAQSRYRIDILHCNRLNYTVDRYVTCFKNTIKKVCIIIIFY